MMRITTLGLLILTSMLHMLPVTVHAQEVHSRFFTASDGTRLHYLEAGNGSKTLAFIPGWLMPAAIFDQQIKALSKMYRVVILDPRSQGQSAIALGSHAPERRVMDIKEWLSAANVSDFVLVGWSLGVLESLDFLTRYPADGLRGLVLIDNSIGVGKSPGGGSPKFVETMRDDTKREAYLRKFANDLYRSPPPSAIAQAVVESTLKAPPEAAIQLLQQPYPRTYWRDAVLRQSVPVLYAVTPKFREQASILQEKRAPALVTIDIYEKAGHALFVDEPQRFNRAVLDLASKAFRSNDSDPNQHTGSSDKQ